MVRSVTVSCTFKTPTACLTIVRQELLSCVDKIDCMHLQEWLCAHADHDSLPGSALAVLQKEKLNVHELLAIALLANEGLILFRPNKVDNSTETTDYELIFKHVKAMRHLPALPINNKQKTVAACASPTLTEGDELVCDKLVRDELVRDELVLDESVRDEARCGHKHTGQKAQAQSKNFSSASPSMDLSDLVDSLDLPEWLQSIEQNNTCTDNAFADECERPVDN